VLPFFELSDAASPLDVDARYSSALPAAAAGATASAGSWRRGGLARLLCDMRGSVFLHTKKRVFAVVLDRTVTRAKKAEDDYDYPEDLPQVSLNRPKAAAASERADPAVRLSYSLFGQAFDELHFMGATALRMAYTHPMDDGQERTFKVKFEGEGVDDYGGPYREVFAQFCAELQATKAEEGVDGGAERCVLPLLMPCPNRRHGVGSNRERFVVAPDTLLAPGAPGTSLYAEMLIFLGQVIGIAMRSEIALQLELPALF